MLAPQMLIAIGKGLALGGRQCGEAQMFQVGLAASG